MKERWPRVPGTRPSPNAGDLAGLASGGRQALASKGPGSARCKLDPGELRVMETVLDAGPAASGWSDQCWTLARIAEIVHRHPGRRDVYALYGGGHGAVLGQVPDGT
ncbi:hypothetical protein GCM10027074_78440 [Streptomyces deserti]